MNKASLFTLGRKLQDDNLYVISIHDLEPSGLIVHAYDQSNSQEYVLPVSEFELAQSGITRNATDLTELIETIQLVQQGDEMVLQSTNDSIGKIKKILTGNDLEKMIKSPMQNCSTSLNDLLVTGLVELCKVKPVGVDAVKWLGEWLISNNPNKPVVDPGDE
mmetsp:Transcript_8068/g.12052  ORF Transcript_8068/g.12052 Transcript_8068/m.12052 type:complete len:162 (+) Transcript_8068:1-486(+)